MALSFAPAIIIGVANDGFNKTTSFDGAVLLFVYAIVLGLISTFAGAFSFFEKKDEGARKTFSWTWSASVTACIALLCGISSIGGAFATIAVGGIVAVLMAPAVMRFNAYIADKTDGY